MCDMSATGASGMSSILPPHPLSPDVHVYVCPHTAVYVSSYCYMCVLILLYMSAHTAVYVSSSFYMCPHPSLYVSSSCYRAILRAPMLRRHRRWTRVPSLRRCVLSPSTRSTSDCRSKRCNFSKSIPSEAEHREEGGCVWEFLSSRGYLPGKRFGANLLFVPVAL
jgi:hypothetical protein